MSSQKMILEESKVESSITNQKLQNESNSTLSTGQLEIQTNPKLQAQSNTQHGSNSNHDSKRQYEMLLFETNLNKLDALYVHSLSNPTLSQPTANASNTIQDTVVASNNLVKNRISLANLGHLDDDVPTIPSLPNNNAHKIMTSPSEITRKLAQVDIIPGSTSICNNSLNIETNKTLRSHDEHAKNTLSFTSTEKNINIHENNNNSISSQKSTASISIWKDSLRYPELIPSATLKPRIRHDQLGGSNHVENGNNNNNNNNNNTTADDDENAILHLMPSPFFCEAEGNVDILITDGTSSDLPVIVLPNEDNTGNVQDNATMPQFQVKVDGQKGIILHPIGDVLPPRQHGSSACEKSTSNKACNVIISSTTLELPSFSSESSSDVDNDAINNINLQHTSQDDTCPTTQSKLRSNSKQLSSSSDQKDDGDDKILDNNNNNSNHNNIDNNTNNNNNNTIKSQTALNKTPSTHNNNQSNNVKTTKITGCDPIYYENCSLCKQHQQKASSSRQPSQNSSQHVTPRATTSLTNHNPQPQIYPQHLQQQNSQQHQNNSNPIDRTQFRLTYDTGGIFYNYNSKLNIDKPKKEWSFASHLHNYFSLYEVSLHNTIDDCWLVMNNEVFDVTSMIRSHPGGCQAILRFAGRGEDVAQHFRFHSPKGQAMWYQFRIGVLRYVDIRKFPVSFQHYVTNIYGAQQVNNFIKLSIDRTTGANNNTKPSNSSEDSNCSIM